MNEAHSKHLVPYCLSNLVSSKKAAFTLAEVLITLGIIGIVAAMTIPTLITNHRNKQLQVGLKKAYSELQQALLMYQAENGFPLSRFDADKETLMKYFKVAQDCGLGYSDRNTACVPNDPNRPDTRIYKNFNGTNYVNMECFDDGQFVLADGALIMINTVGACPKSINIDVNGYKKGPNRLGQDLFVFLWNVVDNPVDVYPAGAHPDWGWNDRPCNKTSKDSFNGLTCTVKALNDKDFFNNLPK